MTKINKNKNVSKKKWMYIRSQGNHTECVCRKLNTKSEFAKKTEENELRGAGKNDNSQPKAKQIRKVPSGRQPRGYITKY
jgi:hypothetical protein